MRGLGTGDRRQRKGGRGEEPIEEGLLSLRKFGPRIRSGRLHCPVPDPPSLGQMWLLPVFSILGRLAAHIYYRVRFTGPAIPAGPVLLVANHPNSLIDPTLVVAAGSRPVRFLAKAPLFADRKTSWMVKAAGAIPVYRRSDDPTQMSRNEDAFRAVFDVLASGAVVGVFPEGVSHSEPGMVPLKTGAARIALGAAAQLGQVISIVPVGLSFRAKEIFRSDAFVVRGFPVAWGDLAANPIAKLRRHEFQRGLLSPRLWNSDQLPWNRCRPSARTATM